MAAPRKYPQELPDRAVRLALESDRPIAQIVADLGDRGVPAGNAEIRRI